MAKSKRMKKSDYENIVKELSSQAGMIAAKQKEKQMLMDSFVKERKQYMNGKISRKALRASVPRINKELRELDKEIKEHIKKIEKAARAIKLFANRQKPKTYVARMEGVRRTGVKKRKSKPKKKK